MIYLGADHGGYELKEKIKSWLKEWKLEYEDVGAHELDTEDDYPQFAFAAAEKVSQKDNDTLTWKKRAKGILACRSSGGVIIAANKIKGVRAVAAHDVTSAKHAREHNDANMIAISGDWTSEKVAKKIIKNWLETEFSKEERHERRINQIIKKEGEVFCGCGEGEEFQGCCGEC